MYGQRACIFEALMKFLRKSTLHVKRYTCNVLRMKIVLNFRLRRIEFICRHFGLKAAGFMRAVAKRFFIAMAAAAQRNRRATGEIEFIALRIKNFKLAFDANVAVVVDGAFRGHAV